MNTQPEKPRIPKEKRIGTEPAEALDLGKEIEADLLAVDKLIHFEFTPEFQAFRPYMNQGESEAKAQAREAAKNRLDDLKKRIDNMTERLEKILSLWESELEK